MAAEMAVHEFGSPFLICDEEDYLQGRDTDDEREDDEEEEKRENKGHQFGSQPADLGTQGQSENEAEDILCFSVQQREEAESLRGETLDCGKSAVTGTVVESSLLSVCEQSPERSVSVTLEFGLEGSEGVASHAQPNAVYLGKHQEGELSPKLEVSTLLPPMEIQLTQVYTTHQYTHFTASHGGPVLALSNQTHTPPFDQSTAAPVPKKKTRTLYSTDQLQELERLFQDDHYPDGERRKEIAAAVGVTPQRIMVWFQNRRAKWRKAGKGPLKSNKNSQRSSYFQGPAPSVPAPLPTPPPTLPPYSSLIGSLNSSAAQLGQVYVSKEHGPAPMHSPPPIRRASLSLSLDPSQHVFSMPTDTWNNNSDGSSMKMESQPQVTFVPMVTAKHYPVKTHTFTQPMQHSSNTFTPQYLSNLPYVTPTYISNGHTQSNMMYSGSTPSNLMSAWCQQTNQINHVQSRLCTSEPALAQPSMFQTSGRLSLPLQQSSHYCCESQPGPSQTLSSRRDAEAFTHTEMHTQGSDIHTRSQTHADTQVHSHSDVPFHCDFSPIFL